VRARKQRVLAVSAAIVVCFHLALLATKRSATLRNTGGCSGATVVASGYGARAPLAAAEGRRTGRLDSFRVSGGFSVLYLGDPGGCTAVSVSTPGTSTPRCCAGLLWFGRIECRDYLRCVGNRAGALKLLYFVGFQPCLAAWRLCKS